MHYDATAYDQACLPHHKTFVDPLHCYNNLFNDMAHEGFHRHLIEDFSSDAELSAAQAKARTRVNGILREPGLNLFVQYGLDQPHAIKGQHVLSAHQSVTTARGLRLRCCT